MQDWKPWAAILLLVTGLAAFAAGRTNWVGVVRNVQASSLHAVQLQAEKPSPAPVSLPASLTLYGDVLPPGKKFTLTVHVGDVVSQSTVAASSYVVNIASSNPGDMVSIEVEGQGFYYASLLGSYGRLARRSGPDAVLTVPELDRLRISPISTALYFFTKRALAGRLPVSDQEHERVIASLEGYEVGMAATVLDLLGRGLRDLPAGYANGYALLADRPAYSNFVSLPPNFGLSDEYTAYMAVAPADGISTNRIGQNMLMSGPHVLDDVSLFPNTQVMSQTPTGIEIYSSLSRRNPAFTPRFLSDGSLQVTPLSDISIDRYTNCDFPACGNFQVAQHLVLQGEKYRQLFTGDKFDLWVGLSDSSATYPDYPDQPSRVLTEVRLWAVSNLETMATGFSSAEMLGPRALPAFCKQGTPVRLSSCESALHQFQAGGTGWMDDVGAKIDSNMLPTAGSTGEAFNWTVTGVAKPPKVQSGQLQITTATALTTYWRVDMGDAATDLVVFVARAQDGNDTLTAAGQTAMIDGSIPVGFSDIGPVGTWRYASFEQQPQPYVYDAGNDEAPITTRFVRSADGSENQKHWRTDYPSDPNYLGSTKSGWQLVDGRLYDTRYRANVSGLGFYSCAEAYASGATSCAPRRVRYFRPLSAVGNRLYGIEELYSNTSTSYSAPYTFLRDSRPTYYEKVAQ